MYENTHQAFFKEELEKIYKTKYLYFMIPLILLSIAGVIDSFYDTAGSRILGALPILIPAFLSLCYTASIMWDKDLNFPHIIQRIFFGGFLIALPLIILNLIVILGTWLFPGPRAAVTDTLNHYWWQEKLLSHFLLTGLVSFFAQAVAAVICLFIIVLPVLAVRRLHVSSYNHYLRKVSRLAPVLFFLGLSCFLTGQAVNTYVFRTLETGHLFDIVRGILSNIVSGNISQLPELTGSVLFSAGIILFIISLIQVVTPKVQEIRNSHSEQQ